MSVSVQTPPQPLLRRRLAWQLGVASLMSVVFVADRLTTPGFIFSAADVIALGGSIVAGWWTSRFLVRRVKGDHYYEVPTRRASFIVVALLGVALVTIANRQGWDSSVLAHPVTVTAALWYFWAVLFAFLWLRRYEREHGPVRVVASTP